jgi:serine/threonine protein phosphatase PrpC
MRPAVRGARLAARATAAVAAARRLVPAAAPAAAAPRAAALLAWFSAGAAGGGVAAAAAAARPPPGKTQLVELPPHADGGGAFALDFVAEQTCLAHPAKKRGEDAWFITRHGVGVADGVGGWAEVHVDAGEYARQLMAACARAVDGARELQPDAVLSAAHAAVRIPGSSTAVVATLGGPGGPGGPGAAAAAAGPGGTLRLLNLGDSAGLLLRLAAPPPPADTGAAAPLRLDEAARLWAPLLKTAEQQHSHTFNMPLQLCARAFGDSDAVSNADLYVAAPAAGDVLLLATDGVFDNLPVRAVVALLARLDWRPVRELVRLRKRRYAQEAAAEAAARAGAGAAGGQAAAPPRPLPERLVIRNLAPAATADVTDGELAAADKAARAVLRSASALVAVTAQRVGRDPRADTPFSRAAAAAGMRNLEGG